MRRLFPIFCALALLFLCACSGQAGAPTLSDPAVPETTASDTSVPEATPEPSSEPDTAPILSPGAAKDSVLSAPFQTAEDGVVVTGVADGEELSAFSALWPEADGYISTLLLDGDSAYAAVKTSFYSLEPSRLYRFPADGEPELITDDLSADGRFCLAGDALIYRGYLQDGLWRYDLTDGSAELVLPESVSLLAAADGFLYYADDAGVYRNDSTLTAEVRLFDGGVSSLFVCGDALCGLVLSGGSLPALEIREPDGTLRARIETPEPADNLYADGGRIYIPQPESAQILVYDLDGQALDPIPLTVFDVFCVLWYADEGALYYETFGETGFILCRLPLDGGETAIVGTVIS